ncbi:unnamed protein product [Rotaria sordida]|uniref:Uncharacterized protein n=1 Tax=Rotaria sordida TaxID=392033 RepID=A0A814M615_9BILA|nr:unnamed protein product [Rotaria sordida]CAF1261446.1 unnamed protein product [Rotaria sordida]
MALEFGHYIAIHVCIGIAILILSTVILDICSRFAPRIYSFLNARLFGIKVTYEPGKNSGNAESKNGKKVGRFEITIDDRTVKSHAPGANQHFLTFIGAVTLSMALMALFEGCILASAGLYPGDECPSDPMTCFVFDNSSSIPTASSFNCTPNVIPTMPINGTNAWCYGWVIKRNTVSRVINQIGVCGGILAVIGTLFAFMFQAHTGVAFAILLLSILTFITMIVLAPAIKVSFSVLAYIVCINCFITGLAGCLFNIDEEPNESEKESQNPTNDRANGSSAKVSHVSKGKNKITPVST